MNTNLSEKYSNSCDPNKKNTKNIYFLLTLDFC